MSDPQELQPGVLSVSKEILNLINKLPADARPVNFEFAMAIRELGGMDVAAVKMGCTRSAVYQWIFGHSDLPLLRAIQVDRLTHGKYKAERMAPAHKSDIEYLRRSAKDTEPVDQVQ